MNTPLLGLLLATGFAQGADQPKTDQQALQGTWAVVSGEAKGKPAPEEAIKDARWVIRGNRITFAGNGGNRFQLTFQLDATKTPRAIDLTNAQRKETVQGIYQVGKDTWKLCIGAPGEGRPKGFTIKDQPRAVLFVFRRVKS